ncbi:MAG: hypothetical protein ACLGIV_10645 [Actinomycetes bacterium]
MGLLDRLRRRARVARTEGLGPALRPPAALRPRRRRTPPIDAAEEVRLRRRLHDDPNDEPAFARLADIVRRRAAEGHVDGDPQRAAADAVWALSEELAGNHRAWHPLIELARLSIHEDREGALRRLGTAAERDPTGRALAEGVAMLREVGMPSEALNLGVGHWRPREHTYEAGRHLVHAAVEAGRIGEARRHLAALEEHPEQERLGAVRAELERAIAEADERRGRTATTP